VHFAFCNGIRFVTLYVMLQLCFENFTFWNSFAVYSYILTLSCDIYDMLLYISKKKSFHLLEGIRNLFENLKGQNWKKLLNSPQLKVHPKKMLPKKTIFLGPRQIFKWQNSFFLAKTLLGHFLLRSYIHF
jgi:hypothetical protein